MATVTGDVVRDYSAETNANPWVDADFTARNSMTPIISGFALKSNFNSAGFYSYTAAAPDQDDFEVKGEALNDAATFGDQVGCGCIDASGNGYILWVNGNQWRIYKCDAFALTQLGGTENISHSELDRISMRYQHSAGTVTATARLNGVDTALVRQDSTSIHTGDLEPTWYFNFDNNNSGGFRSIAVDGITTGPQIISINSGSGIESGSTGNALVVSGFSSPVTALTVGGLAMTAVINTSGDNYTFADPGFIDGEVDPGFGTLSAVASNTGETSAGFNVTRTLDADLTPVVLSTLSEDPETISAKAAAQGLTIAAADTLYYGDGLTIYGDGTISDAEDGDHEVWHRDEATDVMTLIIVTIGAGAVVSVGITMRALTGRQITMRSLTMRSL